MHFEFVPTRYSDRQSALSDFGRAVKAAVRQDTERSFNHEQLVLMLLELAKNTFDHSGGIGILDLQLPGADTPLLVSYLDTGTAFDWETCSKLGVSEKVGNGINFGLGLAFIRQGAITAGWELSVTRVENGTKFKFK